MTSLDVCLILSRSYAPPPLALLSPIAVMSPPPAYNEFVSFTHGYARIVLHNDTALQWQFINDVDGSVLEQMWILK